MIKRMNHEGAKGTKEARSRSACASLRALRVFVVRCNGGYTLVEVVVALAIAAIVLAGVAAALVYAARGYRREDLQLVRSRVAQRVLGRLDDDIGHLDGSVRITTEPLDVMGYSGNPVGFMTEPRWGAHILNAFTVGTVRPDYSNLLPFEEHWKFEDPFFVLDIHRSLYLKDDPRPRYAIDPWCGVRSAFVVRVPPAEPGAVFLPMVLGRGLVPPRSVLWAFLRQQTGTHPPGTILRWSSYEGLEDLTVEARLRGDVALRDQWLHVTTASGQKGAEVFELLIEATLEGVDDPRLNFPSPAFLTRRTITAGL